MKAIHIMKISITFFIYAYYGSSFLRVTIVSSVNTNLHNFVFKIRQLYGEVEINSSTWRSISGKVTHSKIVYTEKMFLFILVLMSVESIRQSSTQGNFIFVPIKCYTAADCSTLDLQCATIDRHIFIHVYLQLGHNQH